MGEKNNQEKYNYSIINNIYIIRLLVFIVGIFILALGVVIIIKAGLGVPTWDVLHIGLANLTNLSMGRWVQILGVSMILVTSLLEKKKPAIGSVFNIILVGYFINIILEIQLASNFLSIISPWIRLLVGIIFMGTGSGMYVASKLGAGPREGMTLYFANKLSISIRLSRTLLEITALIVGWLIGGPVSFGTFISIFLIGPTMQFSLKFWTRQLNKLDEVKRDKGDKETGTLSLN